MSDEYRVEHGRPRTPHGNTKTGLPFYRMEVGDEFTIPAVDYNRTNSARAHFQKKHPGKRFSSRSVRHATDQRVIVQYIFKRET